MPSPPPPRLKSSHNPSAASAASAAHLVATGGDRLDDLIAQVDILAGELRLGPWSRLGPWCPDVDPVCCDVADLEHLLVQLCIVWADTGAGDSSWMD